MRNGLLGSLAALAASAGLAFGQSPKLSPGGPAGSATAGGPPLTSAMPGPYGPPPYEPLAVPPNQPLAVPPGQLDPGYSSALDALGAYNGSGAEPSGPPVKRLWAEGEFLIMWVKDGPNNGAQIVIGTIPNGAVPGTVGAVTIFGDGPFQYGAVGGARATVGGLFPGSNRVGLEASGMILPRRDISAAATSGPLGIPVIGIPFVNELTGQVVSLNASSPANPGSAFANTHTMTWTAGVYLFDNIYSWV
jgi:hypothetical protein